MLNKVVQQWFADPDFKALSTIDKQRALGGYFDDKLSAKFSDLPENELSSVKNDFIEINLEPHRPPPPSRGVLTDLGVSVARGIVGAPETYARALAALDKAVGVDDGKSREIAEDISSFRDDALPVSKEASSPGWRRDWTGAAESTVQSLAVTAPSMAAGVAGAAARGGGKLAAAAAGQLPGAPLFGMAQYDKAYDEYVKKGVPKDQAHDAAVMEGLSETGSEFFSDVLDILLLRGGGFTKPLREATKNSAKRVIQSSYSAAAKKGLGIAASEEAGELANTAIQAEVQRSTGASEDTFWQAIKDNFGQITVSSLIFGALGGGLHKARSNQVRSLITDKDADPEERLGAVREVYDEIARTDPGLADRWRTGATMAVLQGKSISEEIDEDHGFGVQGSGDAAPVGAAGEDTTAAATSPAEKPKRKKTAAEIFTGRVAPSRQPSVAPEEEIAAGTPLPQDEARPAISAVEALTGRRAPMRQPSQAPVEIEQQPPTGATPAAIAAEDVQGGALPPAAEAPGSPVKEPWEMTRREYAETSTVNRGNNYLSVRSPDGSSFVIRTIDTAKYTDADAITVSHKDYIKKALKNGNPVPSKVLAEYPDLVDKPPTNAVEALTGRRAPMRQPSQAPIEQAPTATSEAVQDEIVTEGVQGGTFPSAAEAAGLPVKEPWEMTRREYVESVSAGNVIDDRANQRHKNIVALAIGEGKPVPPTVLAEYPDLVEKPATNAVEALTGRRAPSRRPSEESAALEPRGEAIAGQPVREGGVNDKGAAGEPPRAAFEVLTGRVAPNRRPSVPQVEEEIAAGTPLPQEKPKTDVAATITGKQPPRSKAKDMADWAGKMISRGAARIAGVDYSVQQAGTGSFYYRRTENGIRSEKGPGYPAKWTRKQALIEAAKEARQDFERGQREQEKAEPVEGAAAYQVVEAGEAEGEPKAEGLESQAPAPKDLKFKYGDMVTPTAAGGLNVGFAGRVIDDYFEDGREYVKIEGKGENGLPADSFELQPQPAPAQEKQAPPLSEIMVEIKAYSESGAAMMIKERADTALAENSEQTAMARKILECLNI